MRREQKSSAGAVGCTLTYIEEGSICRPGSTPRASDWLGAARSSPPLTRPDLGRAACIEKAPTRMRGCGAVLSHNQIQNEREDQKQRRGKGQPDQQLADRRESGVSHYSGSRNKRSIGVAPELPHEGWKASNLAVTAALAVLISRTVGRVVRRRQSIHCA